MLELATAKRTPPALLASIGIHLMAFSAVGFGPLVAFPETPGWRGEVWVVTQPDLSFLRDVKTVDLRDRVPESRPARGGGGGRPGARRDGETARSTSRVTQPGTIQEDLPTAPDTEPGDGLDDMGGVDDGTRGGPPGPGSGGEPGAPMDFRDGYVPPDVVLPVPLETPSPAYPDTARIARAAGVVVLSATIDESGRVVEVEVESAASPLLVRAAVDTVSRWRYVPARFGSRPVAVILRVRLTFRLL